MSGPAPAKIGIIGTGAWGTALAQSLCADRPGTVILHARRTEIAEAINTHHQNPALPDVALHTAIRASTDLADFRDCAALLVTTPAQHLRATMQILRAQGSTDIPLLICAKGIEIATGQLMSEVAAQELPDTPVAVFTGPTFAHDIVRGHPAAITLAASDPGLAAQLRDLVGTRVLRPYVSDDIIGAQVGGAIKNVIAIGCGMVIGAGLGESARAALLTRGLAEMARLAVRLGGKRETLMGLSGLGDLMLTATSLQSRNFSLGVRLGEGQTPDGILAVRQAVTEGVHTARAVAHLAARLKVDMPVSTIIDRCLHEELSIGGALMALLDRPLRGEVS